MIFYSPQYYCQYCPHKSIRQTHWLCVLSQVIYVSRNPKDVVLSFYHFHKIANFLPEAGSFAEFLKRFLEGTRELTRRLKTVFSSNHSSAKSITWFYLLVSVHFGSWFDHVKGWVSQTAALNNLLHITYEEMSMVKEKKFIIVVKLNVHIVDCMNQKLTISRYLL